MSDMEQAVDRQITNALRMDSIVRKDARLFRRAFERVVEQVESRLLRASRGPWKGIADAQDGLWVQRFRMVQADIDLWIEEAESSLMNDLEGRIQEIVEAQTKSMESIWGSVDGIEFESSGVEAVLLLSVMESEVGWVSLKTWIKRAFTGIGRRIKKTIVEAASAGDGPASAAQRIRKKVAEIAGRLSRTLARTTVMSTTGTVNENVFAGAKVERLLYVAVLDAATCGKCAASSGKVFGRNDPNRPLVPQHPNCRCVYVPYIEDRMGNFQSGSSSDYVEWLRRQGESIQKEILGPIRWKRWKAGLPLEDVSYHGNILRIQDIPDAA